MADKQAQYAKVIAECLETERRYLEDLTIIVKTYRKQLSDLWLLGEDQLAKIFLNVTELSALHEKIVQELDPQGTNFCTIIHKHVAQFGKLYSEYCESNDDGIALWQQLAKGDKRLSKFEDGLKDGDGPCKGFFVKDFLIKPVQRICKYPLLFRELKACCPETDEAVINSVTEEINVVLKEINTWKDARVNLQVLNALTARIQGYQGTLLKADRKLVRESKARMCVGKPTEIFSWTYNEADDITVVLLNDLILICKSKKGDKLKLLISSLLHEARITDSPLDHPFNNRSFFVEFPQDKESGLSRMFLFEKPPEKGVTFKLFRNSVAQAKADFFRAPKVLTTSTGETEWTTGAKKLCDAVRAKDSGALKTLLTDPNISAFINLPDPNEPEPSSALYLAAKLNIFPLIPDLLNSTDININFKSINSNTCLHVASQGGFPIPVAMLLVRDVDSTVLNTSKKTAKEEAKGEAVEVFKLFDEGGVPGLLAKYPILVNCIPQGDLASASGMKTERRNSGQLFSSKSRSESSGKIRKIRSREGELKVKTEEKLRNVCGKCNKKLLQDFRIDYCYLCGAQVVHNEGEKSPGRDKSPRKKSLSTTEFPTPVPDLKEEQDKAKLEAKIKYKMKYKIKFEEKLKAQGLTIPPTEIAPSGSVAEEIESKCESEPTSLELTEAQ